MTRAKQKAAFLAVQGVATAQLRPLAGDASARRYDRLSHNGQSLVLMDDPSETSQPIRSFLSIATHLRNIGLSAPEVIAADIPNGFLLMEDLGDAIFAREVLCDPNLEEGLYCAATDVIHTLHNAPPPDGIAAYDARDMARATDLAFLWYQENPPTEISDQARAVMDLFHDLLRGIDTVPALSLRDYHAENLLWLPERHYEARVGLLDFQDAVVTHPIYDLVSLIRDARRDVSPGVAQSCLTRFAKAKGMSAEEAQFAAALIAVQRNLRILGIFARLSRQMGKPGYIDLIPRVWEMLVQDLQHPELSGLRDQLIPLLPRPTADFLNQLRVPCPTPS